MDTLKQAQIERHVPKKKLKEILKKAEAIR